MGVLRLFVAAGLAVATGHSSAPRASGRPAPETHDVFRGFVDPMPVTIHGYSGDEMEPDISPDGDYLLFNDSNQAPDTALEYATSDGDGSFTYRGEVQGANDPAALSAVPALADDGTLYFVSSRSYATSLSTVYEGAFSSGSVTGVRLVPGVSAPAAGTVDFDVDVNSDDATLYVSVGDYGAGSVPQSSYISVYDRTANGFVLDPKSKHIMAAVDKAGTLTYAADISPNGKELFYTQASLPAGEPSIYRATRSGANQAFGHVQAVGAATGFAEAPCLSSDGRTLYFHELVGGTYVIYRASLARSAATRSPG